MKTSLAYSELTQKVYVIINNEKVDITDDFIFILKKHPLFTSVQHELYKSNARIQIYKTKVLNILLEL